MFTKKTLLIITGIAVLIIALVLLVVLGGQDQKNGAEAGDMGKGIAVDERTQDAVGQQEPQKQEPSSATPLARSGVMDGEEEKPLTEEEIKINEERLSGSIKSGEFSECDKLQGEFKNVCRYNILMNQAVEQGDKTICGQIDDENYKKGCLELVEKNKQSGVSIEKKGDSDKTREEEIKESVLSGVAYKNLMEAYESNNLTDPVFNEFIKIAAFVNQPKLCWELAQELRQECIERAYILQAKREDDVEICDKIPTPAWKNECYVQVLTRRAVEQNNPEICNQLIQAKDKEKCKNEF